jgi:predicted nucleotide-binding protein (sugar kinase/HSP70/actin superfamily)
MKDQGCKLAVDETCLSVKVYLGHVAWLAERTDAVLVPRVVSERRSERECVKMWGIHDIARNALPDANIIGYSVDAAGLTHERRGPTGGLVELATSLGAPASRARLLAYRAMLAQDRHDRAARNEALAKFAHGGGPRVLVAGHGYNLEDEAIGAPIVRTLRELGCDVIDSEATPKRRAKALALKASPALYWTNSQRVLGSVKDRMNDVDGIVFIITFPCGPDSLVTELAVRTMPDVPTITLVLDEHSGEGGLRTRLESFVDIVQMRKERAKLASNLGVKKVSA